MKQRLDVALVERGLIASREKAKVVIMEGLVYVNGQKSDKAGAQVKDDDKIEVRGETLRYVSRGGKKLEKAMWLGNLGEQFVLISPAAFEQIRFIHAESVPRSKYFVLRSKRDKAARFEYLNSERRPSYGTDELYMLDIMRQGVKADDTRLR